MPSWEGKVLAQYDVGKEVGKGAMGTVYIAMDSIMKEHVAIKSLKKKKGGKRDHLMHEVSIMKRLAHENMVRLHTVLEHKQELFLILEFVGGGELFDKVKVWKRDARERNTYYYFRQLMTGLRYLHAVGYAHRDLKLENLLVSADGILKIADFGVSKDIHLNPMKTICGSPDYIAPELLTSKEGYDGRLADIWSCGVILYAMLCGEFPFEKTEHIVEGKYKPPKWCPKLAQDSCLDKILIVDPTKRLQSAEAVMSTEWMSSFKAQRNCMGLLSDAIRQTKKSLEPGSKMLSKTKAKLRFRLAASKILVMVKVVNSLSFSSIKGLARDFCLVSQDRLKFVLRLLNSCVRVSSASVRLATGSSHEVDWKNLGKSSDYLRHIHLFGEVCRADLGKLTDEQRIASMINVWHIMYIHGCVTKGMHVSALPPKDRVKFFDQVTHVVGYVNLSLNDIKHGLLRANSRRPKGLFSGKVQVDAILEPDKLENVCEVCLPEVHTVLTTFSPGSPPIRVYYPDDLEAQLHATTSEYLAEHVHIDANAKPICVTLPHQFKKYACDWGNDKVTMLDWIASHLPQLPASQIRSVLKTEKMPQVKYSARENGFNWKKREAFEQWDAQQNDRFLTAVQQRVARWEEAGRPQINAEVPHGFVPDGSFMVRKSSRTFISAKDFAQMAQIEKEKQKEEEGDKEKAPVESGWGASNEGSGKKHKHKKRRDSVSSEDAPEVDKKEHKGKHKEHKEEKRRAKKAEFAKANSMKDMSNSFDLAKGAKPFRKTGSALVMSTDDVPVGSLKAVKPRKDKSPSKIKHNKVAPEDIPPVSAEDTTASNQDTPARGATPVSVEEPQTPKSALATPEGAKTETSLLDPSGQRAMAAKAAMLQGNMSNSSAIFSESSMSGSNLMMDASGEEHEKKKKKKKKDKDEKKEKKHKHKHKRKIGDSPEVEPATPEARPQARIHDQSIESIHELVEANRPQGGATRISSTEHMGDAGSVERTESHSTMHQLENDQLIGRKASDESAISDDQGPPNSFVPESPSMPAFADGEAPPEMEGKVVQRASPSANMSKERARQPEIKVRYSQKKASGSSACCVQ